MPVIPVLRRLRQEDHKFEVSLGYKVSSRPVSSGLYSKALFQKNKQQQKTLYFHGERYSVSDTLLQLTKCQMYFINISQ
jgi:hypothetical protein